MHVVQHNARWRVLASLCGPLVLGTRLLALLVSPLVVLPWIRWKQQRRPAEYALLPDCVGLCSLIFTLASAIKSGCLAYDVVLNLVETPFLRWQLARQCWRPSKDLKLDALQHSASLFVDHTQSERRRNYARSARADVDRLLSSRLFEDPKASWVLLRLREERTMLERAACDS